MNNQIHVLTDMTVALFCQENFDKQQLSGKILVNLEDCCMTFIQNKPRGKRSKELMRTAHSRIVKRPDGDYTLTFHFSPDEPLIGIQLIEELGQIIELLLLNPKRLVA